uniref:Uncharacterized protein n=1 Tax=Physcomitrium patens TaxID=3218 RepID=A0A2K1JCF9_PHYPA|nr:hypothetical protein PHYPA_019476 [Physcomitrium patens]
MAGFLIWNNHLWQRTPKEPMHELRRWLRSV